MIFKLFLEGIKGILPQARNSNPVSALIRPMFEAKRLKAILGANLAAAVVVVGTVGGPVQASLAYPEAETVVIEADQVVVTTEGRFQMPVETIGISQGFSRFHRGWDMRAYLHTEVYPADKGVVVEIENGRWGYGHKVVVEHESGFSSLYAHLGEIRVEKGQEVAKDTALGEVGMTGWTTGPHLHFEIYEKGQAVNPGLLLRLKER